MRSLVLLPLLLAVACIPDPVPDPEGCVETETVCYGWTLWECAEAEQSVLRNDQEYEIVVSYDRANPSAATLIARVLEWCD